jgi:hypothetical protein
MNKARLTIRTLTDILDVVPTLVGFIPTESLVVIYLDTVNARDRVGMTARLDLSIGPDECTAALQIIQQHAHCHDAIMLVAYSVGSDLADRTLLAMLSTITEIEIKVAISATAEGWAEVEVGEPIHRHSYSNQTSVVATAMVAAGLQRPQQTRADLGCTIAGPRPADASRFAALLAAAKPLDSEQLTSWLDRWTGASPGQVLDVVQAAALVACVQDLQVRDAAWAAITCNDAEQHIDLWRQVARLVDGPNALPVLALLGMAAWIGHRVPSRIWCSTEQLKARATPTTPCSGCCKACCVAVSTPERGTQCARSSRGLRTCSWADSCGLPTLSSQPRFASTLRSLLREGPLLALLAFTGYIGRFAALAPTPASTLTALGADTVFPTLARCMQRSANRRP